MRFVPPGLTCYSMWVGVQGSSPWVWHSLTLCRELGPCSGQVWLLSACLAVLEEYNKSHEQHVGGGCDGFCTCNSKSFTTVALHL